LTIEISSYYDWNNTQYTNHFFFPEAVLAAPMLFFPVAANPLPAGLLGGPRDDYFDAPALKKQSSLA
jgi:hypothetical protein